MQEILLREKLILELRDQVKNKGGITKLSKETNLGRNSLYKTLSKKGNPKLKTLLKILDAVGLVLDFQFSCQNESIACSKPEAD